MREIWREGVGSICIYQIYIYICWFFVPNLQPLLKGEERCLYRQVYTLNLEAKLKKKGQGGARLVREAWTAGKAS